MSPFNNDVVPYQVPIQGCVGAKRDKKEETINKEKRKVLEEIDQGDAKVVKILSIAFTGTSRVLK